MNHKEHSILVKLNPPRINIQWRVCLNEYLAEREGFEPPEACTSAVFKTAAFDHSAISPENGVFGCARLVPVTGYVSVTLSMTSLATKIGHSARVAMAMASDGRQSITTSPPSRSTTRNP